MKNTLFIRRWAYASDFMAFSHLRFEDHNRKKDRTYHYFIVSEDAAGQLSSAAEVRINP